MDYVDLFYAGFYAKGSNYDDCPVQYRSGWWFPQQKPCDKCDGIYCDFDPEVGLSTNLNGIYDEEETKNEQVISVCENADDCNESRDDPSNFAGKYLNKEKPIKLSKTTMSLRRPTAEECKARGMEDLAKCHSVRPTEKKLNGASDCKCDQWNDELNEWICH